MKKIARKTTTTKNKQGQDYLRAVWQKNRVKRDVENGYVENGRNFQVGTVGPNGRRSWKQEEERKKWERNKLKIGL